MDQQITLRIILERPPAGVDFGLQKGRGSLYETIQKQRSGGKDLRFEFTLGLKGDRKDVHPDFVGSIVQGPPGERFVYIDIGTLAGQHGSSWSRRLKVPLRDITWEMIDWVFANRNAALETSVPGTGKDGGPACATVKPFDGWKLAKQGMGKGT
jgi:hypothetical protein